MTVLLSLAGVRAAYGNIEALHGVDLEVREGEIVTLIGANGAGKSTLLMTICGNPRAASGQIVFAGRDITRLETHAIIHLGISQAPEGRRIFPRMTVMENLLMGSVAAPRAGESSCEGTPTGKTRAYKNRAENVSADLDRAFGLFPLLRERREQRGGTLSGGEQQMLAIARALMSRPRLLLLDEPSLGLAPLIVRQIFDAIAQLNRDAGTAILLVEQRAPQALRLAHRGYVMVNGRVALAGASRDLLANPEVRAAYLDGGVGERRPGGAP
jgi:branched-chain amino acid transport system ATP-binding protein